MDRREILRKERLVDGKLDRIGGKVKSLTSNWRKEERVLLNSLPSAGY